MKVYFHVPVTAYVDYEITKAEQGIVNDLYNWGRKITAIKFIREQYNFSLKEAKDLCDEINRLYTLSVERV